VTESILQRYVVAGNFSCSRALQTCPEFPLWIAELFGQRSMTSFTEFWPLYLRAHQHKWTRIGHYCATASALIAVSLSIAFQTVWLTFLGIALGYGIAIASHRLVDGSKSLVLVNPVWGALADFRMCWLALTGGLAAELARHAGSAPSRPGGSMVKNQGKAAGPVKPLRL
jgi:hypothetical protein